MEMCYIMCVFFTCRKVTELLRNFCESKRMCTDNVSFIDPLVSLPTDTLLVKCNTVNNNNNVVHFRPTLKISLRC